MPERVQLSRKKGWRMPPNTVKVDRTTRFANPFVVGAQGNATECIYWLTLLHRGYQLISCSADCCERQQAYMKAILKEKNAGYPTLRGKNLACSCRSDRPCHADVLLQLANKAETDPPFDCNAYLARFGWRIVGGEAVRV